MEKRWKRDGKDTTDTYLVNGDGPIEYNLVLWNKCRSSYQNEWRSKEG